MEILQEQYFFPEEVKPTIRAPLPTPAAATALNDQQPLCTSALASTSPFGGASPSTYSPTSSSVPLEFTHYSLPDPDRFFSDVHAHARA